MANAKDKKKLEDALKKLQAAGIEVDETSIPEPVDERTDEEKVADNVWLVMGFYIDDTSEWREVKRDAKDEREVRGQNVKIFAHNHAFSEECNNKCEGM